MSGRRQGQITDLPPNVEGALWMLASSITFTAMTTLIKFLGDDYSPALQSFYRQLAGLIVLLPLIVRYRGAAFATKRPGLLFFRSAVGTVGVILSFWAFQEMPLADANALSFTRTLWMVPLAAFVVREHVGLPRIVAAVVGFLGVLIMLRPGAGGQFAMGLPALGMLLASLLLAFTVTGMKVLTRDHTPTVLMVWSAVLGVVFGLPVALFSWAWPTPFDLFLLAMMGVVGVINQACFIKGMQMGDAAAMAPMDYTRLIFTTAAGLLIFNEIPTVWTLAGALVVVGSTLFITWRELQQAKSARLSTTPDEPL